MSAVTTAPPAGWYEDDMVPGRERWWDGDRWTERVRRTDFGLDCWGSELHRSRTGPADQPSAHRSIGGRWSEPAEAPSVPEAIDLGFAEAVAEVRGLADDDRAPVDAWTTLDAGTCEIGPVVVTSVALAVAVEDEPLAPPTDRRGKQRSARARSDRRTPKPAPAAPRAAEPDADVVVEQVRGLADGAPGGLADVDSWAPAAVEVAGDDWVGADVRSTTPAAAEAAAGDGSTDAPSENEAMNGRPLADAAAVMAALAALSAPIDEPASRHGRADHRDSAPWRPDASGPVPVTPAAAPPITPAVVSGADLIERHVEAEWVAEERQKRRQDRTVPPRPTMSNDPSAPATSHTFTKIDRDALDAAVALSTMITPATGTRAVPPGPRPAARPVPEPPVAAEPEPVTPAAAAPRPERPSRPSRPAPPLPKWSDKPADGEDEGFVKIASRDRQKRVLGK